MCKSVGQIVGKVSACMTIAAFVGRISIEGLVLGMVIFVSTIWHLFCLFFNLLCGRRDTVLYAETQIPTHPRFSKKRGLEDYFPFGARPIFRGEL